MVSIRTNQIWIISKLKSLKYISSFEAVMYIRNMDSSTDKCKLAVCYLYIDCGVNVVY